MNDVSDIAFVGVPHRWPAFPYPGLRPFKEFEASIFYGRNKHKDAILERLSDSRTVFITGPSGCGKSSLVKAGVIPALGAGLLTQAGSRWRIAVMRPGRQPIENLATELASAFGVRAAKDTEVFTELGNAMEEDQSGLWGAVDLLEDQTTRSSRKQPVLLLVDQFEEIFGPQIRSPSEVDKFVHLVVTQYANPHPRLYLILTCRSDYIGACASFPGLAELINNTQFLASVLDRGSLREAITRPAEDYGGRVEEDLVAEILADMETGTIYDSDNLPLMQHALLWLWRNAAGRNGALVPSPGTYHDEARLLVGLEEYRRGGGMRGILNTHASQVLATSTAGGAEATRIAESMFRRISERDIRGRYHRAPTSFNEICSIANCSREQLEAVVNPFSANDVCFIEARFSRHSPDPLLDVSHESLIRKWRIARVWADQEAEKIRIFRDLLGTAELWQSQNLRPDLLKRRGELQYVEEWWAVEKPASNWAQRYFPVRNGAVHGEAAFALVSRYLQTSIETNKAENFAAEQSRQEQEAQRIEAERQKANADLEVSRRQRDRAVAGVFSVVLLLCAAVGYGYFVTTQKLRLQAQAIALRAEAALEYESPPKAALIALQSSKFNLPDVPEIERVLYRSVRDLREKRVFETTGIAVLGVTYSPKGDIVAILERDKISFHDSTTGQILDRYDTADLNANWGHFQWSTDGKIIALSSRDQTVLLVPCSRPKLKPLFSSCSQSDENDVVKLGDAQRRAGSAKFSRDGSWLITSNWSSPVRKWVIDDATGNWLNNRTFANASFPGAAAITQDMKYIGVGRPDGQILIFDAEKGEEGKPYKQFALADGSGLTGNVIGLEFSPYDPNAFAAATQDGSVWFGTIESSPTYRKLPGMHGVSRQVSFSEDGKYLVAGSDDRNIRVWNLEQAAADPFVLRGHAGPVSFVKFSPDGQSVLSMSADKTVRLWSRSGPFRPERSLEPLERSEPSQDSKRFLDQLRGSPSTFYFAGDVHSNGEIVAASSTGLSLFHPKLPSQPIIEWGALLHWKNVWFATNPDRIVATTEEGVTYTYPYFKDLNALLNFVSMHMPFYGSERMKLSDKEICKLRFDIGQTC